MVLTNKVLVFLFSVTVLSNMLLGGGILWSDAHLAEWRDRAVNGPYKSAGDAFDPLIPGEWDRIVANKTTFASNPQADRRQTWEDIQDNGFAITEHIKMLDAAFYSLVKEDSALATVVKDELMWHATRAGEDGVGMQISPTRYLRTDSGNWWNPGWMTRMLITADFVKDSFSASERTTFNAWISDWAYAIDYSINIELGFNFANRYDRDYITGLGSNATSSPGFTKGYAYKDARGVLHNQVAAVARYYNNRRAIGAQFFGLAGVFLNDAVLKDRGKLYVEEFIRFSVYPDGSVGEFERNAADRPMRGLTYNGSNLETATWIAEVLRLDGDPGLYNYSTTNGIWGTECTTEPAKTLKLAVDTHLDLIENIKLWYLDSGSITAANRIDNYDEGSNQYWVVDINFAPIANRYWDDERIRKAYRRENPTSVAYSTTIASAGSYGPPWGGTSASVPSLLFMFADMEDVGNGPITPPVEPPVTDGLLSSTQWQNLSIELQAGQFSAEYDVVPNVSNMNGTTGLSLGNAATWDDLAVIVGFSEAGQLNARNGDIYTADTVVPYSAGTSYHFRIVGDIPAHTYSVYVTEGAGTEIQLANNYAFRSSQATVSSLDNLAVTAVTGSHTVSNFTISASVALDTIAPSVPVGLSASAVSTTQINLTWTASSDAVGVAGYTIYREGAEVGSTDTSSYSDVGLSASSSYAYSLAAYDAAGNYSSQSAAVSASTEPEVDTDSLPDAWEIQYFGGINAVNGGETEDFDGDGVSNYDEWLAGTDPSNATDFPVVTPPVTDGLLSSTEWQNLSIELQAGQFSAEYD
ncbi:hypothetical protein N9P58_03340, partial [Puniceicoccaceae bacterium]|nr:hypothetical protein [Puniceicoccaceae bacterium]